MKQMKHDKSSTIFTLLGVSLLFLNGVLIAGNKQKTHSKHRTTANLLKNVALNGRVQADPNCLLTKEQAATGYDLTTKPLYNYLSFNFEPCLAVNPTDPKNMIISTFVSDLSRETPILYTLDGGITWQWVEIPANRCQAPVVPGAFNDFSASWDPWVTFDREGNAYASYGTTDIEFTESGDGFFIRSGILVFKSTDKGQSWNAPVGIFRSPGFQWEKPAIFGDPHKKNTVHLAFNTPGASPITKYQKSTDGGNFFSEPIEILYTDVPYSIVFLFGSYVATLPDGTLLLAVRNSRFDTNLDIGFGPGNNEQIYLNRSTDGGKTFGPTITALPDANQNLAFDAPNGYIVRDTAVWMDLAVNNCNGNVYIVTQDSRFYPNSIPDGFEFLGAGSVIITSQDGGLTWSAPLPVNPTSTSSQAYMATVAVLDDGTVGVFYYTDRNHNYEGDDGSEFLQTDVYLSLFDKDLNFLGEKRVTPTSFNLRRAPVESFLGFPAYWLGDYLKSGAAGNSFVAPLPIPKSDVPAGFPLPATVNEYTEITDQQYTVFAKVSPACGFDRYNGPKEQRAIVNSPAQRLWRDAVKKLQARPTWPKTAEEIDVARELRKQRGAR